MIIGTCRVEMILYSPENLKEKRRIINSLIQKLKNKFNISVAEVGNNDLWQKSIIGIAVVSNNSSHANEVLDKVIDFIENFNYVEVINVSIEIL